MTTPTLSKSALTDPSWWHWLLTIPLVALHLLGVTWAMPAVILLCGVAAIYFYNRIRQFRPYPVQVRLAYIVWSAAGMLPYMQWMHWIQLFGTTAMVTVGYCPLIRMISLLPWNRTESFNLSLLWRTFIREPVAGGLLIWPSESQTSPAICCFLPTTNTPLACSIPTAKTTSQELYCAKTH